MRRPENPFQAKLGDRTLQRENTARSAAVVRCNRRERTSAAPSGGGVVARMAVLRFLAVSAIVGAVRGWAKYCGRAARASRYGLRGPCQGLGARD
jgi:hypothetical protein